MRHIISVLLENEAGALSRVAGLFSARGYNIESLTVAEIDRNAHQSRITIVTSGTNHVLEQIEQQLANLGRAQRLERENLEIPAGRIETLRREKQLAIESREKLRRVYRGQREAHEAGAAKKTCSGDAQLIENCVHRYPRDVHHQSVAATRARDNSRFRRGIATRAHLPV